MLNQLLEPLCKWVLEFWLDIQTNYKQFHCKAKYSVNPPRMYNCILAHSTQAKSYHELRTGQTNNNDLTRYFESVTNGGQNFPRSRDSNPRDPKLESMDNCAVVGRERKLNVLFVPRKRFSLDEVSEESGQYISSSSRGRIISIYKSRINFGWFSVCILIIM